MMCIYHMTKILEKCDWYPIVWMNNNTHRPNYNDEILTAYMNPHQFNNRLIFVMGIPIPDKGL